MMLSVQRLLILCAIMVLVGCAAKSDEPYYTIESKESDAFCGKSGLRVVLQDEETQEQIRGIVRVDFGSGSGMTSSNQTFCGGGTRAPTVLVHSFAEGYTPVAFELPAPDHIETIVVPLKKSCTGGPSYFDNMRVIARYEGLREEEKRVRLARPMNYTSVDQAMQHQAIRESTWIKTEEDIYHEGVRAFYVRIAMEYKIRTETHTFTCAEGYMGHGTFVKIRGVANTGEPFERYYRQALCGSGRTDCGTYLG